MKTHISKSSITNLTMIDTAKVSTKGQIVIPEDIRNELGIKKGSKVILRQSGKQLIIIPEKDFEAAYEEQEEKGWLMLAEQSMKEFWENEEDDKEWERYL